MAKITYTASQPVYISAEGRMVQPGEPFTVEDDVPTGDTWLDEDGKPIPDEKKVPKPKKVGEAAAAQVEAVDVYSKLSLTELKAVAGVRKIAVTGKSEAEIAAALRASDAEG